MSSAVTAAEDFAVVVGIDYYPDFDELAGAEQDARDFVDWLVQHAKVSSGNVLTLLGGQFQREATCVNAQPNVSDVDRLFRQLLLRARRPGFHGGRLYIYLTGHGFAPRWDSAALLTAEACENQLGFHLPGRDAAASIIESSLFEEVVLIMDCCRDDVGHVPLRPLLWIPEKDASKAVRHSFCFASRFGLPASENYFDDVGRVQALFSRALFLGLRGAASDEYGRVTTQSLEDFVEFYLPGVGGVVGSDGPRFDYDKKLDIVYIAYGAPPLVSVDIEVGSWPPIRVLDFRLREVPGSVVNGRWNGRLAPGFYRVEQTDGPKSEYLFEVDGITSLHLSVNS